jgi:hypothetical protein
MSAPVSGVTLCPCGAKYWDGNRCASCGERYRPDDSPAREDARALRALTDWIVGGNG